MSARIRRLSTAAPDPVAITVPDAPEPGDSISVDVEARNAAFAPVPDATIDATLTLPGGAPQPLKIGDLNVLAASAGAWAVVLAARLARL